MALAIEPVAWVGLGEKVGFRVYWVVSRARNLHIRTKASPVKKKKDSQ